MEAVAILERPRDCFALLAMTAAVLALFGEQLPKIWVGLRRLKWFFDARLAVAPAKRVGVLLACVLPLPAGRQVIPPAHIANYVRGRAHKNLCALVPTCPAPKFSLAGVLLMCAPPHPIPNWEVKAH